MNRPTHAMCLSPEAPASTSARGGQGLLILAGMILGTIGIFVEEAQQPALVIVWYRCLFGALALLLWGLASGRLSSLRSPVAGLLFALGSGVLMVANWALFFAAISRTSIAVATVVFHIQPFLVMIFGLWFLHEKISLKQWLATLLALCGLLLTTGIFSDGLSTGVLSRDYLTGIALCLVAAICYAGVTVMASVQKYMNSYALAWWQCLVGAVLLSWIPLVYGWPTDLSAWPWLIGIGTIHSGLAYVILFAGMARLSLNQIALLQFVYPLTAVIVDWAVYERMLDPLQICGVILMTVALWSIQINQASTRLK